MRKNRDGGRRRRPAEREMRYIISGNRQGSNLCGPTNDVVGRVDLLFAFPKQSSLCSVMVNRHRCKPIYGEKEERKETFKLKRSECRLDS